MGGDLGLVRDIQSQGGQHSCSIFLKSIKERQIYGTEMKKKRPDFSHIASKYDLDFVGTVYSCFMGDLGTVESVA